MRQILYSESEGTVRKLYDDIKEAYGTKSLPTLFSYFGPYPEYLEYSGEQLVRNFKDPTTRKLLDSMAEEVTADIHQTLTRSDTLKDFLTRNHFSPEFVQFQKGIQNIIRTNIALTITFITLRECVKGWAIAAKKLPGQSQTATTTLTDTDEQAYIAQQFMQENEAMFRPSATTDMTVQNSTQLVQQSREVEKMESTVAVNILPQYIELSYADILLHMRGTEFWKMRVRQEQRILNILEHLPHPIHSPINVVLKLTSMYPDFSDLIYSISDNFPTTSMQKMILSGYMSL